MVRCHTLPCGESNIFKMSAADFLGGVATLAIITLPPGALFGAGLLLDGAAKGSFKTICGFCCCCCCCADSLAGDGAAPMAKGSASPPACAEAPALLCVPAMTCGQPFQLVLIKRHCEVQHIQPRCKDKHSASPGLMLLNEVLTLNYVVPCTVLPAASNRTGRSS